MAKNTNYRFEHFSMGIMLNDMRFGNNALKTSQVIPNINVYTLEFKQIKLLDLVSNRKALLIVTGSLTCPMTASSLADLNDLEAEFGKKISFALLYVREAHPGERYPQPQDMNKKIANAKTLAQNHSINWPVIIDDIDGSLHRLLDTKPNSIHLINSHGIIQFQSLWAGDGLAVKEALSHLADGYFITTPTSQKMIAPFLRSAGFMDETLKLAGHSAYREFALGAPPIALLSKASSFFVFLPKYFRGYAALFVFVIAIVAASLWQTIV